MAKRAMIAIHEHIQQLHQRYNQPFPTLARLTLQLHDEIVLEVRRGLEAEVAAVVRDCMENSFAPPVGEAKARVPFPVSLKVGRTLGTLQPFELPRVKQWQQQRQGEDGAVSDVVSDEVRELLELAAVDEDEWSDYAATTPGSQQARPSLASTVTTSPSPFVISSPSTPVATPYAPPHPPLSSPSVKESPYQYEAGFSPASNRAPPPGHIDHQQRAGNAYLPSHSASTFAR